MKATFRNLVLAILRLLARGQLKRSGAQIVGITGSKGKTSGKKALAAVLERRLKVQASEGNLNSDFGTALTILGQNGARGVLGWLVVLLKALITRLKSMPALDVMVLEMGVDKPGDMKEILKLVKPHVMVFLNVKAEHMDEGQFPNRQAIFDDKGQACLAVPKEGWVVLNTDDAFVRQLDGKVIANVVRVGTGEEADLRAVNIKTDVDGLSFDLEFEGQVHPIRMPKVLGDCHVHIALAAIAVGFIHEIPLKAIQLTLEDFTLPPGRMSQIEGVNGSLLIDSSYNASPDSMEAALDVLALFPERRIAALGTMNELGELTESEHLKIGKLAAKKADMLITVGKYGKTLAEGAQRGGMSASDIHVFRSSKEAGEFLKEQLERGDTVLAKGSQNGVRMEHLVKRCMKEPEQARHLLIRQSPYWLTNL